MITDSCACGTEVGTAAITAGTAVYAGTARETAEVTYSPGWTGGELTISYKDNGTATASITIGDATASVTFEITQATVVVTADEQSKTYGAENPELTYTVSGLIDGDTLTGTLETAATAASDVGEYDITVGTLENSNYTISYTGAKLTITEKVMVQFQYHSLARFYDS